MTLWAETNAGLVNVDWVKAVLEPAIETRDSRIANERIGELLVGFTLLCKYAGMPEDAISAAFAQCRPTSERSERRSMKADESAAFLSA